MHYPIVIVPLSEADGGGFAGFALDLNGCMSDGSTYEEAVQNTLDAIDEWIETAKERGMAIPEPFSAERKNLESRQHIADMLATFRADIGDVEVQIASLDKVVTEIVERLEELESRYRFEKLVQPFERYHAPKDFTLLS